jgi:hypothetical protein
MWWATHEKKRILHPFVAKEEKKNESTTTNKTIIL